MRKFPLSTKVGIGQSSSKNGPHLGRSGSSIRRGKNTWTAEDEKKKDPIQQCP